MAELKNFSPSVSPSEPKTPVVVFPQLPCVMLNALEVLGFKVVSSTSCAGQRTGRAVVVWTLWKDFDETA